jgi:hypothetical protein
LSFGTAGRCLLLLFLRLLFLLLRAFPVYGASSAFFILIIGVFMVFYAVLRAGTVRRGFWGGTVCVAD